MMIPVSHWGNAPFSVAPAALMFYNPLQTQLWPLVAGGGGTATFGASGAGGFVFDHEMNLRRCKPNEARFTGARRVENIIRGSSQNLTASPWATYIAGGGVAPVRTWQWSGTQATLLQCNRGTDAVNGASAVYQTIISPLTPAVNMTGAVRLSFSVTATDAAAPTIAFGMNTGALANVTLDQTWKRCTILVTNQNWAPGIFVLIGLFGSALGGVNNPQTCNILVTNVQMENVSGQSNQNASEYVTVGMGDPAYAYANVDGVRYFDKLNANTTTGNLVNDISPYIPITTTNGANRFTNDKNGPIGILSEDAQTILSTWSYEWDFSTWAKIGITPSPKAAGCPTGEVLGCALVESTLNEQHYITLNAACPSASTITIGFFCAPGWRTNIQLNCDGNAASTCYCIFDLSAKTVAGPNVTNGYLTVRGAGIFPVGGNYNYCWMTFSGTSVALTALNMSLLLQSGSTYVGSGQAGVYIYGLNVQQSDAWTLQPSPTLATRGMDTFTYPGPNNIGANVGTAYAEIKVKATGYITHRAIVSADNYGHIPLMGHQNYPSSSIGIYDTGAQAFVKTGIDDAFTQVVKVASSWSNATGVMMVTGSGAVPAGGAFGAATMAPSNMSIGSTTWTNVAFSGNIRNVRTWNIAATAGELVSMTSGPAGFRIVDNILKMKLLNKMSKPEVKPA